MSAILAAFDGRLGAAPQMRSTGQGQPWATFSVAVGRGDETEWVSVSAFGELETWQLEGGTCLTPMKS